MSTYNTANLSQGWAQDIGELPGVLTSHGGMPVSSAAGLQVASLHFIVKTMHTASTRWAAIDQTWGADIPGGPLFVVANGASVLRNSTDVETVGCPTEISMRCFTVPGDLHEYGPCELQYWLIKLLEADSRRRIASGEPPSLYAVVDDDTLVDPAQLTARIVTANARGIFNVSAANVGGAIRRISNGKPWLDGPGVLHTAFSLGASVSHLSQL